MPNGRDHSALTPEMRERYAKLLRTQATEWSERDITFIHEFEYKWYGRNPVHDQSGYWLMSEASARSLIEKHIFGHRKHKIESFWGGHIRGYYMTTEYDGKPRAVFRVWPTKDAENKLSDKPFPPRSAWVIDRQGGLHVLRKQDEKGNEKGLFGEWKMPHKQAPQ
jgi:hypothetical protein